MKKDAKAGSGLTVGADLGDRWSQYCVLEQQGRVLEEDIIATTGRALRKCFGDMPAARVVIEVGTQISVTEQMTNATAKTLGRVVGLSMVIAPGLLREARLNLQRLLVPTGEFLPFLNPIYHEKL